MQLFLVLVQKAARQSCVIYLNNSSSDIASNMIVPKVNTKTTVRVHRVWKKHVSLSSTCYVHERNVDTMLTTVNIRLVKNERPPLVSLKRHWAFRCLKKVQKKKVYIYRNTGIILQILLWSYRMCDLLPSIYIKVTILVWAWACNKTLHVSLPKKLCDLKNWVLLPKRQCDRCTHENETLKKLQLSVLREACHTYKMRCRRRLYVTNWASSEHLCQDSKPSQQSCVDNYTHTHTQCMHTRTKLPRTQFPM